MNEPTRRTVPLREQLQEALNQNQIQIAKRGVEGIDELQAKVLKQCEARGLTGMEQITQTGADFLKALLIRGISK